MVGRGGQYKLISPFLKEYYSITIMDNFSRAIISSARSPKQDLIAYLIVLYAAIGKCPTK
jgi:hypothetical protein